VYRAIEAAVSSLARLANDRRPTQPLPVLPVAASPPLARDDYMSARAVLTAAGIAFAEARSVRTVDEAIAAASELGYPVVLKALGGGPHKSDTGGVILGLHDRSELAAAATALVARARPQEMSVERAEETADGFELIIGARWDARFGPIVLAGAGGLLAEVFQDVAVALAPVDEAEALTLLESLRCAPALIGARGRPPLDTRGAARALMALSRFAAAHPEVAEVEVNPLIVRAGDAVALDAHVVLR
jgi:acyl-CoA synthetase (NDP forming)